ncbi:MFS transporter [Streptomyces sp. URMC 126]|uniref:MFS transporter n=1 Tax=Streptomyces sp. URMC 126 TaxID=3423401 RepID=UPI003F1DC662
MARLPRAVLLLVAARAVNRLGAFSLSFLTVLVSTEYGTSATTAGLVTAGFGLASIPSRLAGGRLADRIGRRRTIVLGLTGCAVTQLGIAGAPSLTAVAVWAVLLGLVFELYEPPSQAMIADAVGPADRVRAFGLLNAALAVGGMGAGLLAAGLGHWGLRWLFVVDALTCLVCAAVVRCALPADHPSDARRPGPADGPAPERTPAVPVRPWRDPALLLMLLSGTVFALVLSQIMTALPLALTRRGLEPADAGFLFTVSAVTVVAVQPALRVRRFTALSAPAALALGYVLVGLGVAGYAAAHTLPAHAAATVVWSLGDAFLLGRAFAVVAGLAPPGGTGRYLAVYGLCWGVAAVAAPIAGTQLLQHAGPGPMWLGTSAVCLLLAAAQPLLVRPAAGPLAGESPAAEPPAAESPAAEPLAAEPVAARPETGEQRPADA